MPPSSETSSTDTGVPADGAWSVGIVAGGVAVEVSGTVGTVSVVGWSNDVLALSVTSGWKGFLVVNTSNDWFGVEGDAGAVVVVVVVDAAGAPAAAVAAVSAVLPESSPPPPPRTFSARNATITSTPMPAITMNGLLTFGGA